MYVTRLRIEGLRDGGEELQGLERVAALPVPPARSAVADALTLFASGLLPNVRPGFSLLGWGALEVVGDPEDGGLQLQGLEPSAVLASVQPEARSVTIDLDVHLDPPLYGQLRAQATRDPRVVTALGQRAALSIKVGWLFNGDHTVVTPSVLGLRIGEVAFETAGKERPIWLPEILRDLGGRFSRTSPFEDFTAVEARLRAALLATDPARRAGFRALVRCLQAAPFGLPEPGLAEVAGQPTLVFGPELRRIRQLGRPAADAVRYVEAAIVGRPDVLVVDEAVSPEVASWLRGLPETDGAPIEQVWMPHE